MVALALGTRRRVGHADDGFELVMTPATLVFVDRHRLVDYFAHPVRTNCISLTVMRCSVGSRISNPLT